MARQHGLDKSLYNTRLARNGWVGNGDTRVKWRPEQHVCLMATRTSGSPADREAYTIINTKRETRTDLREVYWADWDQQGRFVFARDGKLFTGRYSETGSHQYEILADFNASRPESIKTPDWAAIW